MKWVSGLRSFLVRKSVRVFPVGVTAIAVSGLLLAVAPSASATTYGPFYLKETFASYNVGAPSLALYDPVVQTLSGREVYLTTTAAKYHYKIRFKADTSKCVAAADNGDTVDIKPCSGAYGVVWIAYDGPNPGSFLYESQHFSGKYLSGDGTQGHQFHIRGYKASGWLQQFREVSP